MKFTKMHGIGNDYVYVNCFEETVSNPSAVAKFVSDRHFGIGSDGLILIKPSDVADCEMDMYNLDGSQGAMCGNGIRCVAKYAYDYGIVNKTNISVATKSGIKYLDLTLGDDGKVALVKVNMGAPILTSRQIPVVSTKEQVIDEPLNVEGKTPFVILMVGVNGVGKTTTIGKLARQFEQQGKSVMLAAGDTFRAAAVEQLQVWGQRNNIPVIAQHTGADSASVIFDAIQAAKARNIDVLIADTAGRLQNKSHLMEELKKIVRVMKKLDVEAPHEVMLTIDASTGQNAVSQAKLFHEAVGLTGITLTKLDGTAKGGVIFSVADQFGIPIRYIGVGERIEDLRPFKADDFIEALFARED